MLCAEFYHIDFMGRKKKMNCWTTSLKFQNKCIRHSSYIYIKYDQDFKKTHFTSIFTAKNKVNGVTLLAVWFTQKNGQANPKTSGHTEIRQHCPCKVFNSSQILKKYFL